MRILAIRGENLASLAGPFEIDLAAEPLSGVGLFAITGETGAGKSTILDALCLALYGEYPRTSAGRNEAAPDPSGHAMTARDPRAILRRGSASAVAEVDFVGHDRKRYRARWAVHRARGRAQGRPQDEQRTLTGLDEASFAIAGKADVRKSVERLNDLTFEQFRRTVLLAQGEFDAFLNADEAARAELLEKITGTDIYARIGRRVYEATVARRQDVLLLEHERGAVALLDDAAREALLADQERARAEVAQTEQARLVAATALARAERLAAARASVAAARARVEAATGRLADLAGEQAKLQQLTAIEPVRRRMSAAAEATVALGAAEAEARRDAGLLEAAGRELQAALADVATAEAEAAEAARINAVYEGEWRLAERRDAEIERAVAEVAAAEQAADAAGAAAEAASAAHARLEAGMRARREEEAKLADQLRRIDAHRILADRREELARLLAEHEAGTARARAARAEAAKAAREIERLQREQQGAEGGIDAQRKEREAVVRRIGDQTAALAGMDVPAREVQREALVRLAELGEDAVRVAERHRRSKELAARRGRDRGGAEVELAAARSAHGEALAALSKLEAARREIAGLVALADATASREATVLRSALADGAPCPVCGATDHPFASHDGEAQALAKAVRQRRKTLDDDIATLDAKGRKALAAAEAAEARRAAAERECADAEREAATCADRLVALLGESRPWHRASAIGVALPGAPEGGDWTGLLAAAATTRGKIDQAIASARVLQREIDEARGQEQKLAAHIDELIQSSRDGAARIGELQQALQGHEARAEEIARTLADLMCALAPLLAAGGLTEADLARNAAAARTRLLSLADACIGARARHEALLRAIAADQPAVMNAGAVAESRRAEGARAAEAFSARKSALETIRAERSRLLGGEAAEAHRKRHLDRAATAVRMLDKARARERGANSARAAADATAKASAAALAAARRRDETTRAEVATVTAATGLAAALVTALLALGPEERQAMAERVASAEREQSEARAVARERERDLAAVEAEGLPQGAVDELRANLATHEARLTELREGLAALRARIAADDEARKQVAGIAATIEAARAALGVWEAVTEAVGSADGDKFRKFAQAVTLGELARLANAQLRLMNPRYRLIGAEGSLTLNVVDIDMGEEVRSIRSLSGGERFLVSLSLALGLSGLEGRQSFVDTLFIDEGFGSLDPETLDLAIDALEALQGQGRKVGVITHVTAMIERIGVQVRVEKRGQGTSRVRVVAMADKA